MRLTSAVFALALVVLLTGQAYAHPAPEPDEPLLATPALPLQVSPPPEPKPISPLPLAAAGLVLLAFASLQRRLRRAVAMAVVLSLSVLAFEGAVHSVHHLGDAKQSATCAIAVGCAQLHGATPLAVAVDARVLTAAESITPSDTDLPVPALRSASQGRAPPA